MKQGCLIGLCTWAAAAAAYWYLLAGQFYPPVDWIVPLAGGLVMLVAIGQLRASVLFAGQALNISRAANFVGRTGEKPNDGDMITATGRIRAIGQPLHAPFSGVAAVLYEYDIDCLGSSTLKAYSGMALTPSVIDSPLGPIRLLGYPLPEGFHREQFDSDEALRRASEWVTVTPFEEMGDAGPVAVYRAVKAVMSDDEGNLRKDYKMRDIPPVSDMLLHEMVVVPGEKVCAIGHYSAAKGGLVADLATTSVVRLIRGDPATVAGALWWQACWYALLGAVIAAICNVAILGLGFAIDGKSPLAFAVSTVHNRLSRDAPRDFHRAVKASDIKTMEDLTKRGLPVDARDEDGRTALTIASDLPAIKWLIAHGADVNAVSGDTRTVLMAHVIGDAAIVKLLIDAGAKVDTVSTQWGSTALKQALDNDKAEVAEVLRAAGAHDESVTQKNGSAVNSQSPPVRVAIAYLAAMQREDRATLEKLTTFGNFQKANFTILRESRPIDSKLVGGFANPAAATVAIRGVCADGTYRTHTYQLIKQAGEWRITDERWETRLDAKEK